MHTYDRRGEKKNTKNHLEMLMMRKHSNIFNFFFRHQNTDEDKLVKRM